MLTYDWTKNGGQVTVYLKLGIAPLIEDAIADNILATMGRLGCALAPQSSHLESVHLLAQHE